MAPIGVGSLVVGRAEEKDVLLSRFVQRNFELPDVGFVVNRLLDCPRHRDDVYTSVDSCAHGL